MTRRPRRTTYDDRMFFPRTASFFRAVLLALLFHTRAQAVILYGTSDPSANTTAPTGSLAGSGWQYEGTFGGFLGTAIGPNYFITAQHIGGNVSDTFTLNGVAYTTTAAYSDPGSDLRIWQVAGTFPTFAPLYSGVPGTEIGLSLVVFGRGTQRGSDVLVGADNHLGGWLWGAGDGVKRWGTNVVTNIVTDSNLHPYLQVDFDASGGDNEAHLSAGDSGGGVFVYNPTASEWQLAGVNYGVDGPFGRSPDGSNPFLAAMFDTTGLYENDGAAWVPVTGPSAFYSTEIAGRSGFIDNIVSVPEPATWLVAVGTALLVGLRLCRRGRNTQTSIT